MCRPASFIVTSTRVFWSRFTDSHESIIEEVTRKGYELDDSRDPNFVRVEVTPPPRAGRPNFFAPLKEWEFKAEVRSSIPDWFCYEEVETTVRKELPNWVAAKVLLGGKKQVREGLIYVVGGTLIAKGDVKVIAYGESLVEASHGADVVALDNTRVSASRGAHIIASNNAFVKADWFCHVSLRDESRAEVNYRCIVEAYHSSTVSAKCFCLVEAHDSSTVQAINSTVRLSSFTGHLKTTNCPVILESRKGFKAKGNYGELEMKGGKPCAAPRLSL